MRDAERPVREHGEHHMKILDGEQFWRRASSQTARSPLTGQCGCRTDYKGVCVLQAVTPEVPSIAAVRQAPNARDSAAASAGSRAWRNWAP
jgi:hypothetical protein